MRFWQAGFKSLSSLYRSLQNLFCYNDCWDSCYSTQDGVVTRRRAILRFVNGRPWHLGAMSFSLATRPDGMSLFLLLYIYFVGDYPVQCTLTLSQITSVNHTGSSMHVTFVTFVCGSVTLALCSNNHHSRPNSWRACILLCFSSFEFIPSWSNVLQIQLIDTHQLCSEPYMVTLGFYKTFQLHPCQGFVFVTTKENAPFVFNLKADTRTTS